MESGNGLYIEDLIYFHIGRYLITARCELGYEHDDVTDQETIVKIKKEKILNKLDEIFSNLDYSI